jgi:hypothetical protein
MQKWRVRAAWALLITCLALWPISCQTFAKEEPAAILSLSWAAIIIECISVLTTQEISKQQKEGDDDERN